MREAVIALVILSGLLLAVDVLVWQGLRRALRLRPGSRGRRRAAWLHWGTAALVPPLLAFGLFLAGHDNDEVAWRIISTVGVLYLPKVVLAGAVLVDWLVAGTRRLVARVAAAGRARRADAATRVAGFRTFSVVALGLGTAFYGWLLVEAYAGREALTVQRLDVPVAGLPAEFEGLIVAHVSDLHLSSLRGRPRLAEKVVAAVNGARPDLVVCTGDLAPIGALDGGPEVLGRLEAPLGTFAVPGNHDFGTRELAASDWDSPGVRDRQVTALREAYASRGARLLVNEAAAVARGGARLTLVGTGVFDDHHGFHDSDLDAAMAGVEGVAILLTHNPELWDLQVVGRRPIAVTLAGHTHGGQIGLEAGPLRLSLAGLSLRRWGGLYREGSQVLYVNRGIGLYGPPFRAGIPAEVALLRLVRAPSAV